MRVPDLNWPTDLFSTRAAEETDTSLPAWIAAAPSLATVLAVGEVLTQCEKGRAMPSMSAVSGVSYLMW